MARQIAVPKALGTAQVKQVLATFNQNTATGFRNYVLFKVLFKTGMRISEALNMTYASIETYEATEDKEEETFYHLVTSKNGRGADIFLEEELVTEIKKMKEILKQEGEGFLFTAVNNGKVITSRNAQKIANIAGENAKLPITFTCHKTRHSYLTNLYQKTEDIRFVQACARHKDIGSTAIYAAVRPGTGSRANTLLDY